MYQDDSFARVHLSRALPCGLPTCSSHALTTTALVERDSAQVGLWTLLPICEDCANHFQDRALHTMGDADTAEAANLRDEYAHSL